MTLSSVLKMNNVGRLNKVGRLNEVGTLDTEHVSIPEINNIFQVSAF